MREVPFEEWQWEEELLVFSLEEVGLGISLRILQNISKFNFLQLS